MLKSNNTLIDFVLDLIGIRGLVRPLNPSKNWFPNTWNSIHLLLPIFRMTNSVENEWQCFTHTHTSVLPLASPDLLAPSTVHFTITCHKKLKNIPYNTQKRKRASHTYVPPLSGTMKWKNKKGTNITEFYQYRKGTGTTLFPLFFPPHSVTREGRAAQANSAASISWLCFTFARFWRRRDTREFAYKQWGLCVMTTAPGRAKRSERERGCNPGVSLHYLCQFLVVAAWEEGRERHC